MDLPSIAAGRTRRRRRAPARLPGVASLGLALAGALAGFLLWNRPPASIFLGNGGAYAVGLLLATMTAAIATAGGWRGLAAAGVCLGVFAFELTFTVVRRLRSRTRLTEGDREHTYDILAMRLGSRPRSTAVLLGAGAACAGAAVLAAWLPAVPGLALCVLVVLAGLFAGWNLIRKDGIR